MFSESPAMRRTAATNADMTASRGLLFGNAVDQLGQVRAIYLPDPRLFIVFPAECGRTYCERPDANCWCVYLLRAAAGCRLLYLCRRMVTPR